MECALWLNRRKVFSADEIKDNLDAASLLGYFAAGSLIEWLRCHGGADFADKLELLSPDAPDILVKIAAVFGGAPAGYKALGGASDTAEAALGGGQCSFHGKNGSGSGFFSAGKGGAGGSFSAGSGSLVDFGAGGSFGAFGSGKLGFFGNFGSFKGGSFRSGSGIYEWEWEWERFFGSFGAGSFAFGSGYAAMLALLKKYGSFGSFGAGSFGSFSLNLLGEMKNGSFVGKKLPDFLANLDEYDRIMLISLYGCPLNQFGYGIHNI